MSDLQPSVGPSKNSDSVSVPNMASTSEPSPLSAPGFKVYKPSNSSSATPLPPLPDEYFTPTPSDLRAVQNSIAARAQYDAPLQLRKSVQNTNNAKQDRWPNTTIRVRFPDRTQLEKVFPSTNKIRSVYAFVRESLRDDVKPIKFILYQTPPKRDLKVSDPTVRDLTLAELQLAPSSVLHLRFEDESLNGTKVQAPLTPCILAQAVDLPPPPVFDESVPKPRSSTSGSSSAKNRTIAAVEKKIPKWFKGIGKK